MAEKTIASQTPGSATIPAQLAILPLQDAVLVPEHRHAAGGHQAARHQAGGGRAQASAPIGVVALRDRDASPPAPDDVYTVGTVAIIQKMIKVPDGTLRCIISGTVPFKVAEFTQAQPYLVAKVEQLEELTVESDELTALSRNLASQYTRLLSFLPSAPKELELEVNNINDPNLLSYFIASTMRLDTPDKQAVLEERDTLARLRMLTAFMARELEVLELGHKIQTDIQKEMDKNQREYYLAPAAQGHPRRTRRDRSRRKPTSTSYAKRSKPPRCRRMHNKAALRELDRLGEHPIGEPRVLRHPHLSGLARHAAVVGDD